MLFNKKRKSNCGESTLNAGENDNNRQNIREPSNDMPLTSQNLRKILDGNSDVVFMNFNIGGNATLPAYLLYVDGLSDSSLVGDFVLKPLVTEQRFLEAGNMRDVIRLIESGIIYFPSQIITNNIMKTVNAVMSGSCALVLDNCETAILFDTKGFDKRAITEPTVENVTKGSKDSFVETLRTNTATVRRKIKTQNLCIEQTIVGKQTLTPIAIVYIKGLANTGIIDELKRRLDSIDIDSAIVSGSIEEFVSDNVYSTFPQILSTERPDKFCSEIVEGRVGIIIDGIPVAFIVPGTLVQFLQAPEDYSRSWMIGTIIRVLRFSVLILTAVLPAYYIGATSYHPELIPFRLAIAIAESSKDVAFPTFAETLFMLVSFEVLFEASLRIPRSVGQAITIVGTIVIGQSAVTAKLVSPVVVVVLAITSTASFVMPNQDFSNAIRLWRFLLTVMGSLAGLFGLVVGMIILLWHLAKLESFGVPYLSPLVSGEGMKQAEDTFFRLPLKFNKVRPANLKPRNKKRKGGGT
ncbi:MAG: spore germination protein [Bacillota bacterium]